jgi:signal transduction histidine kinase
MHADLTPGVTMNVAADSAPRTILTVDDQPANLRVLIDCLEHHGFHVAVALSGEEAIERAVFVLPDLILLDVQMTGIDGLETCRRLKANPVTRDIPVVFMTGLTGTRDKLAGFAAGGVDYVTKPIDEAEVLARIGTHMTLSLLRRQLEEKNSLLRHEVAVREQAQAALERSNVELEQLAIERAVRVKAEGESAGLRRLLEERDQMSAERDDMLHLLAHEVRQPLNNASAALQNAAEAIAASGEHVSAEVRTPLVRARDVLDHVIGTLNNALAAATMLSSGSTEPIAYTDLDALVGLVAHDIGADDRARVKVESQTLTRNVQLQPVLMRLALCNVLANALAYSPAGSIVRLRISDSEDPLAIVFEVIDEGEGIPPELLPHIFDKGTRGRNARPAGGAGLGMYIVRKVVALHHGSVEILPNSPRGSIVRMAMPQGVGA